VSPGVLLPPDETRDAQKASSPKPDAVGEMLPSDMVISSRDDLTLEDVNVFLSYFLHKEQSGAADVDAISTLSRKTEREPKETEGTSPRAFMQKQKSARSVEPVEPSSNEETPRRESAQWHS